MSRLAILVTFVIGCAHSQPPPPRGLLQHGMANCPAAIAGANTALALTADGVDLVITSDREDTQRKIVEVTGIQTRQGEPGGTAMHTGNHGGTEHDGHCPIIHHLTTVTSTPRPDGVTIHIRAASPDRAREVQREVRTRLDYLTARAAR